MLILIGRGLDLKEELELKSGSVRKAEKKAEASKGSEANEGKLKVVAEKFEVNFHCAVFRVWKERSENGETKRSSHNRIKNFR